MKAEEFISRLELKDYDFIKNSHSDGECRRYLRDRLSLFEREQSQALNMHDVSRRFLFEWYDQQLNTKQWFTYADSKQEAVRKFEDRELLDDSFDNKYKCYNLNDC